MKILIVKYLPGREFSNTAILLKHAKELLGDKHEITELDLEKNPPPYFEYNAIMGYYRRNHQGKELVAEQAEKIKPMDKLLNQLKKADIVLVVSPMHNFGMPGIIKLWFDAVMQRGVAFDYGEKGPYGLFKEKKALTIFTSAAEYSCKQVSSKYPEWDTYSFLSKIEFTFMGFNSIEVVTASTGNPNNKDKNLHVAKTRIEEVFKKWKL